MLRPYLLEGRLFFLSSCDNPVDRLFVFKEGWRQLGTCCRNSQWSERRLENVQLKCFAAEETISDSKNNRHIVYFIHIYNQLILEKIHQVKMCIDIQKHINISFGDSIYLFYSHIIIVL